MNPREHAGIGGQIYCWTTSPLRRYTDLINQRQLGSLLDERVLPFRDESELLIRAKTTQSKMVAADSHQRRMERFWTLKHVEGRPGFAWPVRVERRAGRWAVVFESLPLTLSLRKPGSAAGASVREGEAEFVFTDIDFYRLDADGELRYPQG